MKLFIMLIFYFMLMMSTLIAMSSNSWMIIWMMLEINLMSFIPVLMMNMNSKTNFLFKYFIIQTISSSSFLMSITLMWINNYNNFDINLNMINMNFLNFLISISMILKMGLVPFHLWYIEIMMNLSWMNIFLMSTWQKIMPLMIISYFNMNMIIYMTVITSSLISSIQGMYQMNLRKIFTFSSINQTSWLTINSCMSLYLMIMHMTLYMIISFNIIYMFNLNNFSYISDIYLMNNYSYLTKFFLFTNILSLAGLPPFLGFLMKLISIKFLILNKLFLMSLILIISSLMTLYFYLRLTYSSMILINSKMKNKLLNFMMKIYYKKNQSKLNIMMFSLTSINFLIMIILIMLTLN